MDREVSIHDAREIIKRQRRERRTAMDDAEKVIALRAALHNIVGAIQTGLTNEKPLNEFVLDVALYALERTDA